MAIYDPYKVDEMSGPTYVRGSVYFRPSEIAGMFPIMHQFYGGRELIICEKINEYMGYELVKQGQSIALQNGEIIETILDEAERRGELDFPNTMSVFDPERKPGGRGAYEEKRAKIAAEHTGKVQ